VGIGLVGAGAFGAFCLEAFAGVAEVKIAAVCDSDSVRAERFAAQYGATSYTSLDAMLNDPTVEIVALNTPPYLHASQGIAALNAGKHLFCEKPLALDLRGGQALRETARLTKQHITVDYVMRRNPLWCAAVGVRESGVFGALLHMDLANHAAGLDLPPDHWFWDKRKSGGIWIEHGVHFFDAFAWVTGEAGIVKAGQKFSRSDGREDRVEALAQYGDVSAHFYHGFTHSSANEQTTVRLTFEGGFITLHGWIPTSMEIASLTPSHAQAITKLLPADTIIENTLENNVPRLAAYLRAGKSAVYLNTIQAGIRELAQSVRDPSIPLTVTVEHGIASLTMALEAEVLGR
jgi:predicted dehydrogenase